MGAGVLGGGWGGGCSRAAGPADPAAAASHPLGHAGLGEVGVGGVLVLVLVPALLTLLLPPTPVPPPCRGRGWAQRLPDVRLLPHPRPRCPHRAEAEPGRSSRRG